ncbi:MAG: ribose-phosphate pyrophosphokinase [Actinomycetota bacterium]|jgi:ribose-phosphate pyrophosphokinase|nr:ribose-phosphate pyrophosphokinase [Actinomycetota bacterium]MCL6093898.1 ribose-phosphate pyrophosphokinase [Actinomycetota bacterium]MDA8167166.1 ribose-phosphate pyrophosphokinase [Actinomycetota bacterium]
MAPSSILTPKSKRLMVFSGRSVPELGQKIAEHLQIQLGDIETKTFSNGEIYVRYRENIRGSDVFLIQSASSPVNDNLMELLIMIQAARLASARRITAVMPWLGYCRQDKKSAGREPISAKLVADLVQVAGADRVLTMDLHTGQVQGFFDIPVDHMTALSILAGHFRMKQIPSEELVIVSPDVGGVKRAKKFADKLGDSVDLAILTKTRPKHNVAEIMEIIGDVRDRVAIMVDDMIDTAGTITAGAEVIMEMGAREVYAVCTHPVLSGPAYERLEACPVKEVVVTDTLPLNPEKKTSKIRVLSTAVTLADTIQSVFRDESVSRLFEGDDQLF